MLEFACIGASASASTDLTRRIPCGSTRTRASSLSAGVKRCSNPPVARGGPGVTAKRFSSLLVYCIRVHPFIFLCIVFSLQFKNCTSWAWINQLLSRKSKRAIYKIPSITNSVSDKKLPPPPLTSAIQDG